MKNIFLLSIIASLFTACSSPSASTEAGDANESVIFEASSSMYAVNASESTVAWTGSKPTGDRHMGTVAIKQGKIALSDGTISGGSFILDMTQMSITDEGMDEETKAKLLGHLTTTDFFEVDKFPTASFSVTGSTVDSLTGNLTIKDITKSITVPYTLEVGAANIIANASFSIDRTQWDVKFNSGNFFENLGEYLINDAVQFDINLVANEK